MADTPSARKCDQQHKIQLAKVSFSNFTVNAKFGDVVFTGQGLGQTSTGWKNDPTRTIQSSKASPISRTSYSRTDRKAVWEKQISTLWWATKLTCQQYTLAAKDPGLY